MKHPQLTETEELALKALTPRGMPMLADIAQMIDDGWRNGRASTDVAAEILQEFDAARDCESVHC
jgi:hypothetical protein